MTVSLNRQFEAALRKRDSWSPDMACFALSECKKRIPTTSIDWEVDDENWGRLVNGGEVVLLINALVPLAFVLSNQHHILQELLDGCLVVPVESFSNDDFKIDSRLLVQLVGREVSSNVNYDQLSIDDLWWSTL